MGWSYTINGLDKEFLKNEKAQMASPLSGLMALHFPLKKWSINLGHLLTNRNGNYFEWVVK